MARKIGNPFKSDAAERKEEQAQIKQEISTGEPVQAQRGRPKKHDEPMRTMTFRITNENHRRLKVYASKNERQISDILGEFIESLDIGEK